MGRERFEQPVSARAAAARLSTTSSYSAQASARSAATPTAPAAASNKVGHPPVLLEVRAGTHVTKMANPRAVHLPTVQKLTVSASEFERVLAKTSRVTERLYGRLRHAPTASARFSCTRRGRKARSSSLDAPSDTDADADGDSFGGSRSRTSRRAHELSLSSAPQAESDAVKHQASKRGSSLLDVGARAQRSPHLAARLDFARMKQKPVEAPLFDILKKIQSRDAGASATAASTCFSRSDIHLKFDQILIDTINSQRQEPPLLASSSVEHSSAASASHVPSPMQMVQSPLKFSKLPLLQLVVIQLAHKRSSQLTV